MMRTTNAMVGLLLAKGLAMGCAPVASVDTSAVAPASTLPDYLVRLAKDGDLYARDAGAIVSAPAPDIAVLRSYPQWSDKGALTGSSGERLTILSAKKVYAAGEEVRVIHVHEATKPGAQLYFMGPKAISGEYVDGVLASKPAAVPAGYDGAVLPSPRADHNYEVSLHHLAPGVHKLVWRFATLSGPTVLQSNVLTIEVR